MLGSASFSNTSWLAVTVGNPPHFRPNAVPIGKSSEVRGWGNLALGKWLLAWHPAK
jgi:hypothetical protein